MSDTTLFRRFTVSGSFKACFLYVFADAALDIGNELQTMSWDGMTTTHILGWALAKAGGIAIMAKAFYSNSAPKTNVSTSL
jgi:hypothetical protein